MLHALDLHLPTVAPALRRRETIIGRIMARVEIDPVTGCWVWQGPTSGAGRGGGYGRMSLDGQTVAVHIVSFTHFNGYVPGKKQVDHVCRNRLCCNPEHLELVTPKRNAIRRSKANRILEEFRVMSEKIEIDHILDRAETTEVFLSLRPTIYRYWS